MSDWFDSCRQIRTVHAATDMLFASCRDAKVKEAVAFSKEAHQGQTRLSQEPYVVHPLLVACLVSQMGGDQTMVISALLHDVVEDTRFSLDQIRTRFGQEVAHIVGGLTKIGRIRKQELIPSNSNEKLHRSALSFRKMLLASIRDIRVFALKLCDRAHNVLTLDALPPHKQRRVAEETLLVYAPIADRLGVSALKCMMEDICFSYVHPEEYNEIQAYFRSKQEVIRTKLERFAARLQDILLDNGFSAGTFEIKTRIKHLYSVFQKVKRKGIPISKVMDLIGIRVLVHDPIDCYRVLGVLHTHFSALAPNFKDYISIPKENGYQTIHTSIVIDTKVMDIQIRTFDMHRTAEFGFPANWRAVPQGQRPRLRWLDEMNDDDDVDQFYALAKNELSQHTITVYSPKMQPFTLPRGSIVLDFAYAIHSEVGDKAKSATVFGKEVPLTQELQNFNIVSITTSDAVNARCDWINLVKTSRAKRHLNNNCRRRLAGINRVYALNILATIFKKPCDLIEEAIETSGMGFNAEAIVEDPNILKQVRNGIKKVLAKDEPDFFSAWKVKPFWLKRFTFDDIVVISNHHVSHAILSYCCHPMREDPLIAFRKGNKAIVHHRLCDDIDAMLIRDVQMFFAKWEKRKEFHYRAVVSIFSRRGSLAEFLQFMVKLNANLSSIHSLAEAGAITHLYALTFSCPIGNVDTLRKRLQEGAKVIDLSLVP